MTRLLIATHNSGKLREFSGLLAPLGYEVAGAAEFGLAEPEETAGSFAGNAQLKARAAAQATGLRALADDSGLSVAAMSGAPGVNSARYADGDYPAAFTRIIAACAAAGDYRAHFTCALALADPAGQTATYLAQCHGTITQTPTGTTGFGYDPIFIPLGHTQSFAELGPQIKDQISHRSKALEQVVKMLEAKLPL